MIASILAAYVSSLMLLGGISAKTYGWPRSAHREGAISSSQPDRRYAK
jgi:hypothetical protein